ncbi:MAG: hypothetical protein WCI48_16790 [Bacteroidota bacterium]
MVTEKPLIKLENIEICRNCRGTGQLVYEKHTTECGVCIGHGRLLVKKEIKITLITL